MKEQRDPLPLLPQASPLCGLISIVAISHLFLLLLFWRRQSSQQTLGWWWFISLVFPHHWQPLFLRIWGDAPCSSQPSCRCWHLSWTARLPAWSAGRTENSRWVPIIIYTHHKHLLHYWKGWYSYMGSNPNQTQCSVLSSAHSQQIAFLFVAVVLFLSPRPYTASLFIVLAQLGMTLSGCHHSCSWQWKTMDGMEDRFSFAPSLSYFSYMSFFTHVLRKSRVTRHFAIFSRTLFPMATHRVGFSSQLCSGRTAS